MNEPSKVADLIKLLVKKKGTTVSKMLADCGLGKSLVSNMGKHAQYPTADRLAKIALYLDVTTDYLLGNTGSEYPEVNVSHEEVYTVDDTSHSNTFGRRLKQVRTIRQLNQRELGVKVGLSDSYITSLEKGKRNVNQVTLREISEVLDCPSDYLIGRSNTLELNTDYLLGRTDTKSPMDIPGEKKEPHMRLARLGGAMVMNKEARECLEKLEVMFRAALDNPLSFINVEGVRGNKGSYIDTFYKNGKKFGKGSRVTNFGKSVNDVRKELEMVHNSLEQQDERLKEIGVTREILKEWLDFNFTSSPPTAEQLHKIYDNYALIKRTGGDSHLENLRRCINKYIAAMAEQNKHDQIDRLTKEVESLRDMNIDKANVSSEKSRARE